MIDETLNLKRIRDRAPYRKSIALTEEDMQRLSYLEKTFASNYPLEVPFSFSKTISKAIELAYLQVLDTRPKTIVKVLEVLDTRPTPIQQSLTGSPADPRALQERKDQKQELQKLESPSVTQNQYVPKQRKVKKFQKTKRGL